MARKHRRDFAGAWHHVMNHGARQHLIFLCDEDRKVFLNILGRAMQRHDTELHGYALMSNHYHLEVRSLHGNLSDAMQHLESTYVLQFNARYGLDGQLFRDRFKNQIVNDERYLKDLLAYIHLNPVRACLAASAAEANWTSHRAYLGLDPCPPWLTTSFMQELFGDPDHLAAFVANVACGRIKSSDEVGGVGKCTWVEPASDRMKPRVTSPEFVPVYSLPRASVAHNINPAGLLSEICRITGTSPTTILTAVKGRGANPARRFAAWALAQSGLFPLKAVAECLRMSQLQLRCLLHRTRKKPLGAEFYRWWVTFQEVRENRK